MEYRPLGRTGVQVSALCVGCLMFGYRASREESVSIIKAAIDAGVNFFDTANMYGGAPGRSEEILGETFEQLGVREKLVLATKVFWPMDFEDPNGHGISRRAIIEQCESSLRRLRTDHIDLYYMHRLDPDIPVDEPLRALDDLIRAGKVRYVGTSATAGWQFVESLWVAKELGLNRFIAETPPYSILDRRIERELIPMAQTFGVAVNPWSPLAGSLLTGIYERGQDLPEGSRFTDPRMAGRYNPDVPPPGARTPRLHGGVYDVTEALEPLARDKGCSMAALSLAWLMGQPGVTSPILGPERLSDLEDALTALDVVISEDDRATIDAIAPPAGMTSPFYNPDADQFRAHKHRV